MKKQGRFWPTEADKAPRTERFKVPYSPLTAPREEFVSGSTQISHTETAADALERVKEQFPLYRAAQWAGRVVGIGGQGEI